MAWYPWAVIVKVDWSAVQLFFKFFVFGCTFLISHFVSVYWMVINKNSVCGAVFGTGSAISYQIVVQKKKRILFMRVFQSIHSSLSLLMNSTPIGRIYLEIYIGVSSWNFLIQPFLVKNHTQIHLTDFWRRTSLGSTLDSKRDKKQYDSRENRRNL
jgi:hypothetical protein